MTAFHGNPQLKQRLEARAKMIGEQFDAGLRALNEGEYAWQVRQHIMPLIPLPARTTDDDFAARAEANETYGAEFGIPARVAFAQLGLFEDMHEDVSPWWPLRFTRAVAINSDLSNVWRDLALYVLADTKIGLALYTQTAEQAAAVHKIIALFEQDSQDRDAWATASRDAMAASHTNRNGGHGKNAKECMQSVGDSAAHAASYFASAFNDPRNAMEAIKWAGWPMRHLAEYAYFARGERYKPRVDDRNMVNVGDALFASAMNQRDFSAAAHKGEEDRWARYVLYADKLIALTKKSAPRSPSLLGRIFSSRLFGIN
jgi:hypothetical protein